MDLFDIVAARVGGGTGGGTPQKQADWNQNDSSKKDYIKNRTHWKEEVEVDYLTLPYVEPIPGLGLGAYGKKIGLEMNTTYTIECEVEGQIITLEATTTEMPSNIIGVVVPDVVYLYQRDLDLKILDGIDGDFATGTLTGTDNCFYNFTDVLSQIKIHGVEGVDTVIHKIPKEYYDVPKVDQVFNPKSENAQSGVAVEQAIENYDNSLIINTEQIANNSITAEKIAKSSIDFSKVDIGEAAYLDHFVPNVDYFEYISSEFCTEFKIFVDYLGLHLSETPSNIDTIRVTIKLGLKEYNVDLPVDFFDKSYNRLSASLKTRKLQSSKALAEVSISVIGAPITPYSLYFEQILQELGGYDVRLYFSYYADGERTPIRFQGNVSVFTVLYKEG